ncbi:MAG: hypothetical protein ACRBBU_06175 [Pseudooceanicola sp.]
MALTRALRSMAMAACLGAAGCIPTDPAPDAAAPETPQHTQEKTAMKPDTPPVAKPGTDPATGAQPGAAIILTGVVVPGVTCPTIRLDDGRTVALSHLPGGFAIGTRVRVSGSGYGASMSCMQEVLLVQSADKAG